MAWYYVLDGASHGPVTDTEIRRLHGQNVVALDTPVWTEGMTEWLAFGRSALASGGIVAAPAAVPAVSVRACAECGRAFPEVDMLHYEDAWVCAACKPLFFQRIKEGVAAKGELRYASVGRRFVAIILDAVFTSVGCLIPLVVISSVIVANNPPGKSPALPGWYTYIILLFDLVPVIYEVVMIANYGATFGKMIMKIKVTRPDGSRISYARSIGRYFAKILSGLTLNIGYLMAFWDDEKRALHDRMCDTRVFSVDPS